MRTICDSDVHGPPVAGLAGLLLLAPAVSVAARAWTVAARPCVLRCTHP
ncbi:MAG TPA: hypothetical protein VFZ70_06340 [Euzebyales bacterium]